MKTILFICYFLAFTVINVVSAKTGKETSTVFLSESNVFDYNKMENLVVFGDSFSSTGTNFNTMKYSGKNITGGKNWPLQLLDLHNMTLWNFSTGGAVVNHMIVPRKDYRTSFITEYTKFSLLMSKGRKFGDQWESNNTLFAYWLGCNDIRNVYRDPKITPLLFKQIHETMFNIFEKLYMNGARNFLIINIPPLDKAPLNVSGKYNYYKDDVESFNNEYIKNSENFFKKHPNVNIIIYNAKEEYEYVMNNYKSFSLISGNSKWSAYKNLDPKYFFWHDRSHLSYTGNKILAEDMHSLLISLNMN